MVTGSLDTPNPDDITMTVGWEEGGVVVVASHHWHDMLRLWGKIFWGNRWRVAVNPPSIDEKNVGMARDHLQEVGGVWLLRHLDGRMNGWYDDELMSSPFISSSFYLFSFL